MLELAPGSCHFDVHGIANLDDGELASTLDELEGERCGGLDFPFGLDVTFMNKMG